MAAPNAIVLATDDGLFPVAMFVADRLARLKTRDDVDVIVFTSSAQRVESTRGLDLPFSVELVTRPPDLADDLLREPTYLRFFALNALTDRRRVVYLDTDVYPESASVFALVDVELGGHALGAARDLIIALDTIVGERKAVMKADSHKYLNAGVLAIDMAEYERQQIYSRLVNIVRRRKWPLFFFDQSALNAMLQGEWAELSPSFNMMMALWTSKLRRVFDPVVVHFAGPIKPWHGGAFARDHPARQAVEAYLLNSPWKAFLSQQWGLKQALAQLNGPPQPMRDQMREAFNFDRNFPGRRALLHYLRHTEFADVRQGLTVPHWEHFPPA